MSATSGNYFWDTNLWIYLIVEGSLAADGHKREVIQRLLLAESQIHISVQVLNEVANVLLKKYGASISDVQNYIERICQIATVHPLTQETVQQAIALKKRYGFSWYDSLIVSAACHAHCHILYSEDMQHGLVLDNELVIRNPFAASAT